MASPVNDERVGLSFNGYLAVALAIGCLIYFVSMAVSQNLPNQPVQAGVCIVMFVLLIGGLYILQPNECAVLQLFGAYMGSDRQQGLRWTIPLFTRRRVSLRARTLLSEKLKVNDQRGNPVEIAAAIIWRVEDSAKALFDVDSYDAFVQIQAESALRHLASIYPYDSIEAEDVPAHKTLRGGADAVARALAEELRERLAVAGLAVDDSKLTHLAYAPEIANAMLRRQQAEAVISARRKIVEGAVGMVEMALAQLAERDLLDLDGERRAAMISNLLVVLCGERDVTPVINSGTLYN